MVWIDETSDLDLHFFFEFLHKISGKNAQIEKKNFLGLTYV